ASAENVSAPLLLSLDLSGDLTGTVKRRVVFSPIGLSLGLSGELTGRRSKPTDLHLGLKLSGEMTGSVRLAIVIPAPILNEAAENAFADQCYAARLLGDDVEIKISSAVIDIPENEIGLKVSAQISEKELSLISLDKLYTFQVGISSSPIVPLTWHTVLEDAQIDSRTFSQAFASKAPNDNLSVVLFSPVTNKLNRGPASNIILYDPNKTEVSGDSIETIYDNNGSPIGTQLVARSGLNLYHILARLRAESGFSSIETNIPNYEITRAEFGITQTFNQSISPFIGVFQPLLFPVGNVLWILDKTAAIPDEFEPRAIVADKMENLTISIPSGGVPDGFELSYIDSDRTANFYTTRTITTFEESGVYGDDNFTRTDIVRTFRDWKNTNNPTSVLRTELISEVHSTYDNALILIGRETQSFVFDAQGKQKSSTRTIEATVPNLNAGGALALLTVREETQTIVYKPDPKNPRRFVQNRIVTQTRGLIAVDSENKYFDEDFKQDFVEAHKAGNLTVSMTSEFGPVKTVTEALHALGNGQYQVRVSTIDHVRGTTTNSLSEPKTGDATLSAVGGRSSKKIVWRTGINQSNRSGIPPEPFSGGEVPLAILEPLCQRLLERRAAGKHDGGITVSGFDPSMDRGVFFSLYKRNGDYVGRFVSTGLRVTLDNLGVAFQQKVTTEITCEEI
ncbi:MAG TPA: hypothetical protein VF556_12695, partial [Pyrinomonadaceae bacterium]